MRSGVLIAILIVVAAVAFGVGYLAAPGKTVTSTVTSVSRVTVRSISTVTSEVPTTVTVTTVKPTTVTVTRVEKIEFASTQIDIQREIAKIMPRLSPESRKCVTCHAQVTPGIVADWLRSRHAHVTPAEAWKKPELEREISSLPPKQMQNYVVGCFECHGANPKLHPDTIMHFGSRIHAIVTPRDCQLCHAKEVEEYERSVKANAHYNLVKNPVYMLLVKAATQVDIMGVKAGGERSIESACFACHGTEVRYLGAKRMTVETPAGKFTLLVPVYKGWPNHGVGRVNPDGSKGSCTACHPRHSFSIAVARSPYTCAQCHLDPDVPAFDVWKESKHGNIFLAEWKTYNVTAVPWVPGRDFRAPSCAVCHFSLLATPGGKVIAPRTHDVGSRIWIRIFGVYAHPQPKTGETWKIRNKAGLPLPYDLATGEPARDYLISKEEMTKRRQQMMRICESCHSPGYVVERIKWFEEVVNETNKAVKAATLLLVEAWKKGIAKGLPTGDNPFDEYIERRWVEVWLFYANSIRYGAAMNGPDWMTFKRGWYQLTRAIAEMQMIIEHASK